MFPASSKLAEQFTVVPYPFVGKERSEMEAEYATLLYHEVKPSEIADMILYALEILLNKREKAKNQNTYDEATSKIADMLGRLLVFEEMLFKKKNK